MLFILDTTPPFLYVHALNATSFLVVINNQEQRTKNDERKFVTELAELYTDFVRALSSSCLVLPMESSFFSITSFAPLR